MKKLNLVLLSTGLLCAAIHPAFAADSDLSSKNFIVRGRAIVVAPQESSTTNLGGDINADNSFMPEIDASYFFTKNVAAELIAATTKHDLKYAHTADVGSVWVLPPTVTLQYHFTPERKFSPYVGAGLNYSFFYGENTDPGFNDLDVQGGIGYAMQTGFDYWLDDNWGLNLDVKKLFLNVDAKVNGGAVRGDIDLDPWIFGAGVSYRF